MQKKLGIPVHHLDALYWKPGWVKTERDVWRALQENMCSGDTWIVDGNYGSTLDIRLQRSDTIIFLNLNRFICLARALWRSIAQYGKRRPDMAEGCEERLDFAFAKWIWEFPVEQTPEILKRLQAMSGEKTIIILSSPREVKQFLRNLSA